MRAYNKVKSEVMNDVLHHFFASRDHLMKGYMIVANNRIFLDAHGKFVFDSRNQAMRAFYSRLNWYVKCKVYQSENEPDPNDRYSIYRLGNGNIAKANWNRFKQTLMDDYNFEIIEL